MSRLGPKYADDQRDAIASAMIDRGMSAPEAVQAAKEGLDGLEPFEMPESTARDVASAARRDRDAPRVADHEARLRSFQDRGMELIERELSRVEESSKQGEACESGPS